MCKDCDFSDKSMNFCTQLGQARTQGGFEGFGRTPLGPGLQLAGRPACMLRCIMPANGQLASWGPGQGIITSPRDLLAHG